MSHEMKLSEEAFDKNRNLLPYDGCVHYMGKVCSTEKADDYFKSLLTGIRWEHDKTVIFGKEIITRRKVAWYGDRAFEYRYSNNSKYAMPWTKVLTELKAVTEKETGETYNSCLLNLYHTGEEGMAWHSDDEPELKTDGAIASLSFGSSRKFSFRHKKTREKLELILGHGSLLIMKGQTQTHWHHSLPATRRIQTARVNLTFRTIQASIL